MPIVFSQYEKINDSDDHFHISTTQGFWRSYGFGMISIYKKDLGKGLETSKLSKVGFDLQIVFIERHFRAKGGLKCSKNTAFSRNFLLLVNLIYRLVQHAILKI
jgi:hypothetical protein